MGAALQSGFLLGICDMGFGLTGSFVALYDNTAGTSAAEATIASASLQLEQPGLPVLVLDLGTVPAGSGMGPAGQTAAVTHHVSSPVAPCGYGRANTKLIVSWDVGGETLTHVLDLGPLDVIE